MVTAGETPIVMQAEGIGTLNSDPPRVTWIGLDWTGLDWTGLDWTGALSARVTCSIAFY